MTHLAMNGGRIETDSVAGGITFQIEHELFAAENIEIADCQLGLARVGIARPAMAVSSVAVP